MGISKIFMIVFVASFLSVAMSLQWHWHQRIVASVGALFKSVRQPQQQQDPLIEVLEVIRGFETRTVTRMDHMSSQLDHTSSQLDHMNSQMDDMNSQMDHMISQTRHLCSQMGHMNSQLDHMNSQTRHLSDKVDENSVGIKSLAEYYQQREKELELIVLWDAKESFLCDAKARNWTIKSTNVRKVYDVSDNIVTKFDGVFIGRHNDVSHPVLFLLKTKRIFTMTKYTAFKKKVAAMATEVLPALSNHSIGGGKRYVKMVTWLDAEEYEVRAVVGSAYFEGRVLKAAAACNTTVVIKKMAADQFTSIW